ncbi:hypothetical protein G7085_08475 [Tessaracoccus sp. HDW20]|uniref:hypothetical protein n=1 Tax=Tessaracoccus coleopterorum TaxID=2714950 RepID=UPI0018D2A6EB|nr:hypothetical protein [Tessaracoccus coleopterorum]NHB84630.1 hypothetical protein [Tessaracoccus coleopterorum]
MLWEPHDAAVVLRERFGHDGAPGAAAWLGSVLSQDFGRQMASCDKIVMSDSNALAWLQTFDGDRLILKWSDASMTAAVVSSHHSSSIPGGSAHGPK